MRVLVHKDGTYTYIYDPLSRLVAVKAKSAGTPLGVITTIGTDGKQRAEQPQ